MGIIKSMISSAATAIGDGLQDQFLEVIEPEDMGEQTVMTRGVQVRKGRGGNRRAEEIISNGSVIHVYDSQFMILTDGGRIIDYTAEPGYYTVDNYCMPSMYNGELGDALTETFERMKFGGITPQTQKVYYINLQEIKGLKFGTKNPVNYFDNFYQAELFLRAHGTYSIKITDPLKFYEEVVPRNKNQLEAEQISEQFRNEFVEALQASINQMSVDGIRISFVTSKSRELSKYMADVLDEAWKCSRGVEIQSVAIANLSYDEESKALIQMRNKGAMMGDQNVRESYMQGAIARGIEAAGNNPSGSVNGFMGLNMGMASFGAGNALLWNQQQNLAQRENMKNEDSVYHDGTKEWRCDCGTVNEGNFCQGCGRPRTQDKKWRCSCGTVNEGNFCQGCGKPHIKNTKWRCSCGTINEGNFCQTCGKPRP